MNISYTEINDLDNNNGNNPYWDLPKPKTEQKKKVKFGYDHSKNFSKLLPFNFW
jgi:hypothetical protein